MKERGIGFSSTHASCKHLHSYSLRPSPLSIRIRCKSINISLYVFLSKAKGKHKPWNGCIAVTISRLRTSSRAATLTAIAYHKFDACTWFTGIHTNTDITTIHDSLWNACELNVQRSTSRRCRTLLNCRI